MMVEISGWQRAEVSGWQPAEDFFAFALTAPLHAERLGAAEVPRKAIPE